MYPLSRVLGTFVAMMVIAYLAMVVLVPAPSPTGLQDADADGGQSAAVRLSAEAQALVSRKPTGALQ